MNPVTAAIEATGLATLAQRLDLTYQAVRKWEKRRVPSERVHAFIRASDYPLTVHDVRPDIFGPAPGVAPTLPAPAHQDRAA